VLRRIVPPRDPPLVQARQKQPFFPPAVEDLDRQMGAAYPELTKDKARVAQVLKAEEERFGETIDNGMRILEQALAAT
jgi:alanyl-tRNA synthetase